MRKKLDSDIRMTIRFPPALYRRLVRAAASMGFIKATGTGTYWGDKVRRIPVNYRGNT